MPGHRSHRRFKVNFEREAVMKITMNPNEAIQIGEVVIAQDAEHGQTPLAIIVPRGVPVKRWPIEIFLKDKE